MDNTKKSINAINTFELIKSCHPNQLKANKEIDVIFDNVANESFVVLSKFIIIYINRE